MTVKRKITHVCSQEETIKRLNYFLVGNGNPQDGILFKFDKFMSEHGILLEDIKEIRTKVEELHGRADENQKSAATAMRAIEMYKLEDDSYTAAKTALDTANRLKRNLLWSRLTTIVTIVISLFMAYMGYRGLMTQSKATQTEAKITNELLAPDSNQAAVTIRGNIYIPVLKTDSANIIRSDKLDDMADKLLRNQ